jgi:serine protease Do
MTYEDAEPETLSALGIRRQGAGGVVVTSVEEGSEAAVAGIRTGDIITEAAGRKILRTQDLASTLLAETSGEGILLLIERSGGTTIAILKPQ